MTAPGITSFSYLSSTTKHSRAGEVSTGPRIVVRTEERPVLVAVLSRVVSLIWCAIPLVSPAVGRPETNLGPGREPGQAPQGWRGAARRVHIHHLGGAHGRRPIAGPPRSAWTTPGAGPAHPCGAY